jgi:TetR/AcrR family transcriptional regulator
VEKDTPTKLIDAATPLFARKGFAAVSVRELAVAAGVNIAAVSYYFRGKEGLYQAVLEEQFTPIAEALQAAEAANQIPALERLALYSKHIAFVHNKRPYFIRFIHSELTNPTPCFDTVVKKYISRIYQFIFAALSEGVAAGHFKSDLDINFASLSLAGIMNFYFIAKPLVKEFMPLSAESDQEYTAQAFRIYLEGIRRTGHE